MDKKLDEIISKDYAPEIDINARKRAVNLAMAEFKTAQNEKSKKTSQGFSFLSRLISIGNQKRGNETMERKTKQRFIYGGTITAMAVVLVGGLSLTQLDDTVSRHQNNTPAVGQKNEDALELAIVTGGSSIPVPVEIQDTLLEVPEANPLKEWQRKVEEKTGEKVSKLKIKKDNQVGLVAEAVSPAIQNIAPLKKWHRDQAMEQDSISVVSEEEMVVASKPEPVQAGKIQNRSKQNFAEKKLERTRGDIIYNAPATISLSNDMASPQIYKDVGRDKFEGFKVNSFKSVSSEPVSTFSSDVDTASYSFIRRQLNSGILPQKDAVRVEEMINYFNYNYPMPESKSEPFKPTVYITDSPWAEGKKLMHIGIKGYQLEKTELRSNIVFLLDTSGSMSAYDKLPLVKNSMKMLLDSLHKDDTVSIVVYAGQTGVVLEPTKVSKRRTILNAMNNLRAGGGTAGAAGIKLAYDMAEQNFDEGSVNRVILATDGDFNVGITNRDELKGFIERKRDKGIFLSVLGFGQGNYNDHMMQTLAQNGNGIAAYIDNLNEARKVLVQEATSSLFPIAQDVKFQIEFNPDKVAEYRLIGYETRALKREDFNNDKIDAGDMGAGHSVTAIYEFVPVGSKAVSVDTLRYGKTEPRVKKGKANQEYAFLKIRYKLPLESKSKLITLPINDMKMERTSWGISDTKFATAVAAFGQILKGGEYIGDFSYDDVINLAQQGKGADKFGYRAEFINMVRLAKTHSR